MDGQEQLAPGKISSSVNFFYKYVEDGGRTSQHLSQAFLVQEKSSIELAKMHSSFATAVVALASLKTALSAPHRPTGPRYLNDLAQDQGKLWFGTAADIPGTAEQTDNDYLRILTSNRNFGEITPANMMKVSFLF